MWLFTKFLFAERMYFKFCASKSVNDMGKFMDFIMQKGLSSNLSKLAFETSQLYALAHGKSFSFFFNLFLSLFTPPYKIESPKNGE